MSKHRTREAIADELLEDASEDARADLERIAEAIRRGDSLTQIMLMPETDRWPATYTWVRWKLECLSTGGYERE